MPSPSSRHRFSSAGFTLIELLVVISIIAILAGLLLPVVGSVTQNAYKTQAKSTEQQIVAAVKNYFTEYGAYPVEPAASSVDVTFDNTSGTTPSNPASGLYGHNLILFNVLRASNSGNGAGGATGDATYSSLNNRQIVYFENNDVKTPSHAMNGFIPTGATAIKGNANNTGVVPAIGDLVDPWGNLYYVRVDANYTGIIENPYNSGSDSGTSVSYSPSPPTDSTATPPADYSQVLRLDVVAWSPGRDGHMGTSSTSNSSGSFTPTSVGDDVLSWQ